MPSDDSPRCYLLEEANYRQLLDYGPQVAVLPWGATEAHNYHLPYATDVIEALRVKTAEVLAAGAAADPVTRKVHESFMAFKKNHDRWANSSERQFATRVRGG